MAGKQILHFAPERGLEPFFREISSRYITADLKRPDVDMQVDITDMKNIPGESYDIVIASDVLEHVTDDRLALREIYRILRPGGVAVITVPQKNNLLATYEDRNLTSPQERTNAFGEPNHLRIYGADFLFRLTLAGFRVEIINDKNFEDLVVVRHVLKPPILSRHPLATNERNLFFATKRGHANF